LWERSRGPNGGSCSLEDLDLAGREALAAWLQHLRRQLAGRDPAEDEARRLFFERMNAGRSD
jgi:hypothetical protein